MSARTFSAHSRAAAATQVPGRFGGLDGLRAIAVGLVLVYHFFPAALPGGFLGVDVFFVISGFLITSLMLREHAKNGRIDLIGFWRRRARRLLPAVALVVLVSTTFALVAGRDLLVGIANQIAGAVFFVSNWVFVANGTDYFGRDTPELFRNFWSLAVEEQFYIVLPLLAILLFKLRRPATRAIPLIIIGLGSAALMASMANAGSDATRIYFGSDSHSFGMMLGAGLAVILQGVDRRPLTRAGQGISIGTTLVGFGGLGWLAFTLAEGSSESFLGGFQLATLCSLAVVWAITREGAWAGRALDLQPLRWIGERSYGIYLWHWPLLLIAGEVASRITPGRSALTFWLVPFAALVLTGVFAALSFQYLEQPVRQFGLKGALRRWFSPRSYTPKQRRVAIVLTAVVAVTFPLSGVAIAVAPAHTSSTETILRGQELLEADRAQSSSTPPDGATSGPQASDASPAHEDASPDTPPAPVEIVGTDITAVGDSVMLASYPELSTEFPGIEVDAAVSRGMWAGVDIIAQMEAAGTLRPVVLIGLSTNGPVDRESLDELRRTTGDRLLVLVNAHADREWIAPANATLEAFAAESPGVTIARWTEGIDPHPEFLAGDGIHPGPSGGEVYAAQVRSALEALFEASEAIGWGIARR